MTDEEVKSRVRETLNRAKEKKQEILREIRDLEGALSREDHMIMSCLAILAEIDEKEAEER